MKVSKSTDGLSATGVAYVRSAVEVGINSISPLKIVEVETQTVSILLVT